MSKRANVKGFGTYTVQDNHTSIDLEGNEFEAGYIDTKYGTKFVANVSGQWVELIEDHMSRKGS